MSGVEYFDNNKRGTWGNATSKINWCEKDYEKTIYLSEFYNTITNLTFNLVGVICYKKYQKYDLGLMYLFLAIQLNFLGLTSGIFHGTNWYSGQKLDEIFMNYVCITLLYNVDTNYKSENFSIRSWWDFDRKFQRDARTTPDLSFYIYLAHCFLCAFFILAIESYFAEFHMTVTILIAVYRYVGFIRTLESDAQICENLQEIQLIKSDIRNSIWHFIGVFLLGYLGWNYENHFCVSIRSWTFNPQFHAFWHIFCGIAINTTINLTILYRLYQRKLHMDFLPKKYRLFLFKNDKEQLCMKPNVTRELGQILDKELPKIKYSAFGLWSWLDDSKTVKKNKN